MRCYIPDELLDGWWDDYGDMTENPSPSAESYLVCLSWWIGYRYAARHCLNPHDGGVLDVWTFDKRTEVEVGDVVEALVADIEKVLARARGEVKP